MGTKDKVEQDDGDEAKEQAEPESVLFVKNLNFETTEEGMIKVAYSC